MNLKDLRNLWSLRMKSLVERFAPKPLFLSLEITLAAAKSLVVLSENNCL